MYCLLKNIIIFANMKEKIQTPDEKDFQISYHLDKHLGFDRHCSINRNNRILHVFESKQQAEEQLPIIRLTAKYILFSIESKIRIHKRNFPELYVDNYDKRCAFVKFLIKIYMRFLSFFNKYKYF